MADVLGYRRDPQDWSRDYDFSTDLRPKLGVGVASGDIDLRP